MIKLNFFSVKALFYLLPILAKQQFALGHYSAVAVVNLNVQYNEMFFRNENRKGFAA